MKQTKSGNYLLTCECCGEEKPSRDVTSFTTDKAKADGMPHTAIQLCEDCAEDYHRIAGDKLETDVLSAERFDKLAAYVRTEQENKPVEERPDLIDHLLEKFPKLPIRENCLVDVCCPACGNRDNFKVVASSRFELQDEGTDEHEDVEYDESALTMCCRCEQQGKLEDFTFVGLDARLTSKAQPEPFTFSPNKSIEGEAINNGQRADWAEYALLKYRQAVDGPGAEDDECYLRDLISDLAHLADKKGLNIRDEVESALRRWEEER